MKMRDLLRGLIGSLQFAAVHTRPDLSSSLSHLKSEISKATVGTLITANRVLHSAKKHSDVTIKIKPINPEDLRFIAFSDASFASKSKPESHAGMIIPATHKDIAQNQSCDISPINFMGHKEDPTHCDKHSVSRNIRVVDTVRPTDLGANILGVDPRSKGRMESRQFASCNLHSGPTYKADQNDLAVADCKSLYDLELPRI